MIELTKHVKERYAERMAGRDTTIDINTFIAQNDDKIEKDLNKLIDHSTVIYTGVCSSGKDPVTVRLSGTWVVILDNNDRIAITLYKIDFGLGEDFNKSYVDAWLAKLSADKAELAERKAKSKDEVDAYKKGIKDNEALISEYEAVIRRLKKDNAYYDELVKGKNAEYFDAEMKVRNDIDALTRRKEF